MKRQLVWLLSASHRITVVVYLVTLCIFTLKWRYRMPRLLLSKQNPIVKRDGTLLVQRNSKFQPCDYFVKATAPGGKLLHSPVPIRRLHYHFDNCFEDQLGNRLGEHYLRHLTANALGIPYRMSCGNPSEQKTASINQLYQNIVRESVLKNLETDESEPGPVPVDPRTGAAWSIERVCRSCRSAGWPCSSGLEVMYPNIKADMQKLAFDTFTGQSIADPDDAVIHLRLGDAIKDRDGVDEGIGLLPNLAYIKILQRVEAGFGPITSIGLVTQAFDKHLVRAYDVDESSLSKSELVSNQLVDHLHEHFPNATIRIHNGPMETPLKSMARLIKAEKVAICGPSTFCTMPVLSVTKGQGYLFRGKKHSPWAHKVTELYHNLHSFSSPRLANHYAARLDESLLLHWLWNQPPWVGGPVIQGSPLMRVPVEPGNQTESNETAIGDTFEEEGHYSEGKRQP